MTMLLVVNGLIAAMLLAVGILFLRGKGAMLISGYNTMSPEEKSHVDEVRMFSFMGKFMLVLAGLWLAITVLEAFGLKTWLWIGVGVFVIVVVGAVIYANTGNRFRK